MVERLKAALLLALLPLAAWPAAQAQTGLADPTRPPNVVSGADGEARVGVAVPRLQSVLISPQRRLAVIDGRTVPLGGKLDDATLVEIAETHVMLKQGAEMRMLELTPGVGKKKGQIR